MFIPKRRVDEFQAYHLSPDGAPPVARRNICSGDVGAAVTSVVETVLPVVAAVAFPPALPFVLGGEAALGLGEGIAGQKPFGQIAEGLGVDAAGAALGGQFGDFLGGAGDFFSGGASPVSATDLGIDPAQAITGAGGGFAPGAFGPDAATWGGPTADVLGGGAGTETGGFQPVAGETPGNAGAFFQPTTDSLGNLGGGLAAIPQGTPGSLVNAAGDWAPNAGQTASLDPSLWAAPTQDPNTGLTTPGGPDFAASFAPGGPNGPPLPAADALGSAPVDPLAAFTAPPAIDTGAFAPTPDIPAAAPQAPVLTDTGILGTSPVMEMPGAGVPAAPPSVDVAAPGAGTAVPGAAAGTGGGTSGLTPGQSLDPFGVSGTASGAPGAPGLGASGSGIPVPDSSASLGGIPQGDTGGSGVGVPGGSPATQLGLDGASSGIASDPLTQLAQAAPTGGSSVADFISAADLGIDPSQAITGSGSGVSQFLSQAGVLDPNTFPSTSSIDYKVSGGPGGPLSGSGVNTAGTTPPDTSGTSVGDILKYIGQGVGPTLGIAGLAKQLLAPNLLAGGVQGGANTAALTAAQQALIDELAQLRQSTLTPAAQQGSQALTQATSTAQNLANQLLSGNLTPAQSQLVANNLSSTISMIRARYGSLGQGSSTSEMEDEAAAQAASTAGTAAIGQQNVTQGTALEQLASTDAQASVNELLTASGAQATQTNALLTQQAAQDAQLNQMIARLAAALGGAPASTGGFTITPAA